MKLLTLAVLICCATSAWAQKSPPTSLGALLDGSGFVKIPPGEFLMGSKTGNTDEQPPHKVRISKGFEMGKYEVTQAQWEAIMSDPHAKPTVDDPMPEAVNPSKFPGLDRPVENITWNSVQQFLRTINKRDSKHVYRLPTEAEWEYAARAGAAEDIPKNVEAAAWFKPNSAEETHPVGQKAPNAWGLYDIYGNVREWVQDWYTPDAYATANALDPQGPNGTSYKVFRGCAWLSETKYCRAAFRGFDFPTNPDYSVGFRLVRTLK